MRIYKNQFGWSYLAKNKDLDGTEIKEYLKVSFSKNCEQPPEADTLDITFGIDDVWICPYKDKNNNVKLKLIIKNWQYQGTVKEKPTMQEKLEHQNEVKVNQVSLSPDDLPFF